MVNAWSIQKKLQNSHTLVASKLDLELRLLCASQGKTNCKSLEESSWHTISYSAWLNKPQYSLKEGDKI